MYAYTQPHLTRKHACRMTNMCRCAYSTEQSCCMANTKRYLSCRKSWVPFSFNQELGCSDHTHTHTHTHTHRCTYKDIQWVMGEPHRRVPHDIFVQIRGALFFSQWEDNIIYIPFLSTYVLRCLWDDAISLSPLHTHMHTHSSQRYFCVIYSPSVGVCVCLFDCLQRPPLSHSLALKLKRSNQLIRKTAQKLPSSDDARWWPLPIQTLFAGPSIQGSITTRQACVDNSSWYTSNLYCKGSCSEIIMFSNESGIKVTAKRLFWFYKKYFSERSVWNVSGGLTCFVFVLFVNLCPCWRSKKDWKEEKATDKNVHKEYLKRPTMIRYKLWIGEEEIRLRLIMKRKQEIRGSRYKHHIKDTVISVLHHFLASFVYKDCLLCVLLGFPY